MELIAIAVQHLGISDGEDFSEVSDRLRWLREQHMTGTELSDPTDETLFRCWRPAPFVEVAA